MAKLSHQEFREAYPNATITAWVRYRYCNGRVPSPLPIEYQQVEFIESTGTQYINLGGISPQTNIEIKLSVKETGGDRTAFGIYPPAFSMGLFNGKWRGNIQNTTSTFVEIEVDNICTAMYSYDSGKWTVNGEEIGSDAVILNNVTGDCYLFARNYQTPAENKVLIGRIYNFRATGNTNLNLIPCYRKEDNVIGMYDTINGVFYTNSGTGTFIKGENV